MCYNAVMLNKPRIIIICGPTGSGKTSLAVFLCRKFGGEIISADSRQVYRGMDVGTGKEIDRNPNVKIQMSNKIQSPKSKKPQTANYSPQTIQGIPIYLVDIKEPNERFTVGDFKVLAEEKIAEIISRGKIPFLVGGTGLYIDSLVDNFQLQSSNVKQNQKSKAQILKLKRLGFNIDLNFELGHLDLGGVSLEKKVAMLLALDPVAKQKVDLKNPRRVERALEVCLATGRPFTEQRMRGERKYEALKLAPVVVGAGLAPAQKERPHESPLREKIDKRVDQMMADGLEKEVLSLAEKYGWEAEAMTGIGYREWHGFVSQRSTLGKSPTLNIGEVGAIIKRHSYQYAKRQMTWFKRDKRIHWITDQKEAEELTKDFLDNR